MKNLMLSSFFLCIVSPNIFAQVYFNLEAGMSPGANPATASLIVNRQNPLDEFQFNLTHIDPQFYGSIKAHMELRTPFFLEGGVSFTRQTSTYQVNYSIPRNELSQGESIMEGAESMIMLPVDIGVTLGPVDITSGLTLLRVVSSSNELTHLKGYSADKTLLQIGWQMGARYAINKTMVGMQYQGKMHRACEGMYVNGNSLALMNASGRFVFTLGYRI